MAGVPLQGLRQQTLVAQQSAPLPTQQHSMLAAAQHRPGEVPTGRVLPQEMPRVHAYIMLEQVPRMHCMPTGAEPSMEQIEGGPLAGSSTR